MMDMKSEKENDCAPGLMGPIATVAPTAAPVPMEVEGSLGQDKEEFCRNWGTIQQENLSSADYYFNSYSHLGIHEEMLKDEVRTGAYEQAILSNSHLFKDKVVLDVGSGTGILSLFAARAGAKHVYAIECSDVAEVSEQFVKLNKLDGVITVIKGKAEEVELPVDKVDIIISEWMGYFLLYESMLDCVLLCRDKWLRPGGLIFPDRATLSVAGIEDRDYRREKLDQWKSVYGFDFSIMRQFVIEEPLVDVVDKNALVTDTVCIKTFDLNTVKVADLDFVAPYKLQFRRKDFVHALVFWFDVEFSACHTPVRISTAPTAKYTHWKQCVFYPEDIFVGHKGDDLSGLVAVRKNAKNPRDLDIKIRYQFVSGNKLRVDKDQVYRLR